MVGLKNITCYSENDIIWEGKILMQQENHFEGIIDSDFRNAYMYGNISATDSSIHITTITPEDYPFHVNNYIAFQENNSNRYFGESIDAEGDRRLCSISVKKLNINRQILESQVEEFRFIIEQHKQTMHERYNEHLQYVKDTYDDRKAKRIEEKLRKKRKSNYYL